MANNIISSSMITAETLRVIHNSSAFLGNINVQYNDSFAKTGAKVGQTVNARVPVQFQVREGATASIQDVNEYTVPITIQPETGIDWAFSDSDLTLSIDKFSERYLTPAGKRLATALDMKLAALYTKISNFSGTVGTSPATAAAALNAAAVLDNNGAPRDGQRTFALNPLANASLVGGLAGLLNDQKSLSKQYKEGLMATSLGMDFQMSQNLPTHTVGGLGGTPLVDGANQGTTNVGATDNPYAATTSLLTKGWTAAVANRLKAGDVITLAGVYAVNPETKANTGVLKTFAVTADVSSTAGGAGTLVLSPAIIAGGAYKNVTALPADGAAVTVLTGGAGVSSPQNILFHKDAFTLVTVDMETINGMDMFDQSNVDDVSLRFVRGYDITNNRRICRFDMLAGYALIRPEWAVRVTS